ncbi:helix-turn-helix domain-containing protein [Vagococcus xieshaowenii]|uniref:XRE family transcriptional regulator n=1 Tax=Vagococcus xieshaowenii TaxID=2562451 RepID=A0AAJ5JQG0_9ENTE|nr:helix-turn-helix transcriptional regulator [Vagococcus xieshaowenii]QCA29170.1 XRE family transcriptional regulator [Vagococcus xieshaowenii]TFZ40852.1 XRE family transcriptional regulator [Vagococcus xieshaowenii]
MNKIKEARQLRKISQKELANLLGITQQSVSYYENGSRTPDDAMWEKISEVLSVRTEYLQGNTDDPYGWELLEERTNLNREEIKEEIERMKKFNHVIGDVNDSLNVIDQAVNNLLGNGNTDRAILDNTALQLSKLKDELNEKYVDPKKELSNKTSGNNDLKIIHGRINKTELVYDDLNIDAYIKALEILSNARKEILKISDDLSLD